MAIPLVYSSKYGDYDLGEGHPFNGARFRAFIELLEASGAASSFELVEPEPASRQVLERVHAPSYLDRIAALERVGGMLTLDTPVLPGMVDAARLMVGGALAAARRVMDGAPVACAFGGFHHAARDDGGGFCLFNDVAVAARTLLDGPDVERVMIIDTDAHHGNGTQDIFYDDRQVLFVSLHQDPRTLYPGRGFLSELGAGAGLGYTVNIPLPPYSGLPRYRRAFDEVVTPLARSFRPDVVIRNGGSDPYVGDELTELALDMPGLEAVGAMVRELSDATCGRLVDLTISGYGDHVPLSWAALIRGVTGVDIPVDYPEERVELPGDQEGEDPVFARVLERLCGHLAGHWDRF